MELPKYFMSIMARANEMSPNYDYFTPEALQAEADKNPGRYVFDGKTLYQKSPIHYVDMHDLAGADCVSMECSFTKSED